VTSKPVHLVVATEGVQYDDGIIPVTLRAGQVFRSDSAMVKRHPGRFEPLAIHVDGEPDMTDTEVTVTITGGTGEFGTLLVPVEVVRTRPAPQYFGGF
jgi:hypothetical protein